MLTTLRYAGAAALLFVFWILMSGYFTPFLLGAGAVSAIIVVHFARRMAVIDVDSYPIELGPRVVMYWPWLVKEIVKSAWGVARIIVDPRLPISPNLVRVRHTQRTKVGRVTYANSITLTPGTITIDAEGDEFLVHALTRAGAKDLEGGEMDRRVTEFEGRG